MKISIAMTTYKSTRFVREQLESIFKQTHLPDEIIICDDASPDNTIEVVKEIIKEAPSSIDIKLYVNKNNLGFARNFEQCFMKCSGDIVFPCDADDIWEEEKIHLVLEEFKKDKEVVYVFHDATIINAQGTVINESLNAGWDTRIDKKDTEELVRLTVRRRGVAYGFTSAIKKQIIEECVPFPKGYGHDEWIGICAPLYGKVVTMPQKLARYRRHGNNTSNNRPSICKRLMEWDREAWFTHPQEIRYVFETYSNRYKSRIPTKIKEELRSQIVFQTHLEKIINKECWGGIKLLKFFMNGTYQKYRGTRNTLILDELYLILHMFK